MNKEIQVFNNDVFGQIRMMEKEGKVFAVGSDVAKALGYSIPSKAVNTHCKGVSKMEVPTNGGIQEMLVITEGDIYRLITKSKLPSAEKFESWVFDEVLPQIRKTGGYIPIEAEMSESEIMARALQISQRTIEQKDKLLKAKDEEIQRKSVELESKNKFINQIAVSQNSLKVEEVAQIASKEGIKIGRNQLWEKLREWELIKKNSKYDPKQEYINRGYFEVVEGTKENSKGVFTYKTTRVLGKGQVYIINRLLKESGIKV